MTLVATAGVMPVFLLGAVALFVRDELGISRAGIGLATGLFFAGSAVASTWGGRRADRLGHWQVMRIGTLASAALVAVFALAVRDLATLSVACLLGGLVNGTLEPATNAALAEVRSRRPGLTFGVKMAAIPLAAFAAGASVPGVAVRVGWRAAFLAAGALPVLLLLAMRARSTPRTTSRSGPPPEIPGPSAPLLVLALACGLGTAGATSLAVHMADGATTAGLTVSQAGWLLSGCGLAGIAVRVAVGWAIDHTEGSVLLRVAGMLAGGAAGYAMLAVGSPVAFGIGALFVYGFGWGWTGLLMYSVVRLHPDTPAAATGVAATGLGIGAALGPLATGQLIESSSHAAAWTAAAVAAFVGSGCIVLARAGFVRRRLAAEARAPASTAS